MDQLEAVAMTLLVLSAITAAAGLLNFVSYKRSIFPLIYVAGSLATIITSVILVGRSRAATAGKNAYFAQMEQHEIINRCSDVQVKVPAPLSDSFLYLVPIAIIAVGIVLLQVINCVLLYFAREQVREDAIIEEYKSSTTLK